MRTLMLCFCFIFLGAWPGWAQQSSYLCDTDLKVYASAESPIAFSSATFTATVADSAGWLEMTNKSSKEVLHFLAIMEFVDESGKYLFSVPVYNMRENHEVPFHSPFEAWLLANPPGRPVGLIGPGAKFGQTFTTPIIALTCPKEAHVSLLHLRYSDGSEFKYVSADLNLSPVPKEPVDIALAKGAEAWEPLSVTGTIQVDAAGHATLIDSDFNAAGFKKWFQQQLTRWQFTAPWREGKPASVRVPFVLMLSSPTDPATQLQNMRKKGTGGAALLLFYKGSHE